MDLVAPNSSFRAGANGQSDTNGMTVQESEAGNGGGDNEQIATCKTDSGNVSRFPGSRQEILVTD